VVDRADARHDAVLERAVVGVMATLTGFLAHDDTPMSTLFASHRPAATQAACLLAAVLVTRARVSGGGAAPLGRAMRWAAKVVGGSGTKTRIGDLFMSCPVDSATPLVRAVKRIVEGATEQEDKVKKIHHHLSFLCELHLTAKDLIDADLFVQRTTATPVHHSHNPDPRTGTYGGGDTQPLPTYPR
jgi:hypothetical protein